jgi:hypothetical protein
MKIKIVDLQCRENDRWYRDSPSNHVHLMHYPYSILSEVFKDKTGIMRDGFEGFRR